MEERSTLKQTILVTVIAINLMLGSLLMTKNIVKIGNIAPTLATPSENMRRIEFIMEYAGKNDIKETSVNSFTGHEGLWVVEHYKEYEVHYNKKGEVTYKQPTGKEDNIRYWTDKNNTSKPFSCSP